MKGNPDSGIWEIFAGGIWNPGFWNPEYNSRNPLQLPLTNNLESRTWNLESTEWNPVQDCLGFPYVGATITCKALIKMIRATFPRCAYSLYTASVS